MAGFERAPRGPCLHTELPKSRLDELMVIFRFRELGFSQQRCEGCGWWKVWLDADGNRVESFRTVERMDGVAYG